MHFVTTSKPAQCGSLQIEANREEFSTKLLYACWNLSSRQLNSLKSESFASESFLASQKIESFKICCKNLLRKLVIGYSNLSFLFSTFYPFIRRQWIREKFWDIKKHRSERSEQRHTNWKLYITPQSECLITNSREKYLIALPTSSYTMDKNFSHIHCRIAVRIVGEHCPQSLPQLRCLNGNRKKRRKNFKNRWHEILRDLWK